MQDQSTSHVGRGVVRGPFFPSNRVNGRWTKLLTTRSVLELVKELRRLGGEEMLISYHDDIRKAWHFALSVQRVLGDDYVIRREGSEVIARARLRNEPVREVEHFDSHRWVGMERAAAMVGVSHAMFDTHYIRTGRIRVRYDTQGHAECSREDIVRVQKDNMLKAREMYAHDVRSLGGKL